MPELSRHREHVDRDHVPEGATGSAIVVPVLRPIETLGTVVLIALVPPFMTFCVASSRVLGHVAARIRAG